MHAIIVRQKVQPQHLDEYLNVMLGHARGSVTEEPGCLRFDVAQAKDDPTEVFLYEVYRDQAAMDAHGKTQRFARVVSAIKPWFSEPERVHRCTTTFLTEDARA